MSETDRPLDRWLRVAQAISCLDDEQLECAILGMGKEGADLEGMIDGMLDAEEQFAARSELTVALARMSYAMERLGCHPDRRHLYSASRYQIICKQILNATPRLEFGLGFGMDQYGRAQRRWCDTSIAETIRDLLRALSV